MVVQDCYFAGDSVPAAMVVAAPDCLCTIVEALVVVVVGRHWPKHTRAPSEKDSDCCDDDHPRMMMQSCCSARDVMQAQQRMDS